MRMSQADLARAVRAAGDRAGQPNGCTPRLIQRWESGTRPQPSYLMALEQATGQRPADQRYASDQPTEIPGP